MTQEEKAQFFALHFGQKVFEWSYPKSAIKRGIVKPVSGAILDKYINSGWLNLYTLSSITDEDAIEVAILFNRFRLGSNRYEKGWKVKRIDNGNIRVTLSNDWYDLHVMISVPNGSIWSNDDTIPTNYKPNSAPWDYMRKKGYAIDFGDYTVEQMIEAGVIKLKEK